jgi:XTP/dITP diphosphohydrolase
VKKAMELVIASRNLHKIREFREMMKQLKFSAVLSLLQFPDYLPPSETTLEEGGSFESNAKTKAEHAARTLQCWVLADDSGLVVPSLNGQPGLHSHRFAGEDATDAENRLKLLNEMQHLTELQRSAYFECSLALASPEGIKKGVSSNCEGHIALQERGRNGFGYDALFIKHGYDKTFSEMDEQTKNRISHRRKALEKLFPYFEMLLLEQRT